MAKQPSNDNRVIIQTPTGSLMMVADHPPESLNFDPRQSCMFSVGIDQDSTTQKSVASVSTDATHLASTMIDCGVLPEENLQLFVTPGDYDSCTKSGLRAAFIERAEKVGRDGMLIFAYAGRGVRVEPQSWSLAGVDFNIGDPITHISAVTLCQWISELSRKPKHILFILDCSSAGSIASEMASPVNSGNVDGLCVLSACGDAENAIMLDTLGCSIFTYFTGWSFRRVNTERLFSSGFIPLRKVYDIIASCSTALSSLVVTYNPAQRELKPNVFTPTAMHLEKPPITMEMVQQMLNPPTGEAANDSTDGASVGRFDFITSQYNRKSKYTRLHDRVLSWLDGMMQAVVVDSDTNNPFSCPLATLHSNGALKEKEVLLTVVCSLVFSLASIQVAHIKDSIEDPNTFICAFLHAVAAVSATATEAEMVIEPVKYATQSLKYYQQVVRENGVKEDKLRDFFWKVSGQGRSVSSSYGHK